VEGKIPGEPSDPRHPKEGRKPSEEPKPGETPKPNDEPKHGDPKPGELPKPDPSLKEAVETPIPAELKKQYEARFGFANYYFNRQNVDRVWKALTARSDFSKLGGKWILVGHTTPAAQPAPGLPPSFSGNVQVQLDNSECAIELPTGDSKIVVANGLDAVLNPPDSGGLLPALYLWRKLLIGGPGRFGQITYVGAAPLPRYAGLFDVLRGISDGVETQFYCDQTTGELVCLEMFPDDESDPCEVYFGDYREVEGRMLPHTMEVHYGDKVFGIFTLTSFDLQKAAEK
jgi:hypothetical protein